MNLLSLCFFQKEFVNFSFITIILSILLIIFFNIIFSILYELEFLNQFFRYFIFNLILIISFTLIFLNNNNSKTLSYISVFFLIPIISNYYNLKILLLLSLAWIIIELIINKKLNKNLLDFKFSNSKYTLFYLLIIFFIFFLGIFQFIPFFLNEKIINFYIPHSDIIIKSSTQELFKNFGIPTLGYDGINFNPQIFFDIFFIGSVNYIFNLDSLTNFYYIGILFPILLTLFMFSKVIEKLDIKKTNYFNFFKVFCFFLILIFLTDLEMLFRIVQSSSTLYGLLFFSIIFYSCILLLQEKKNKFLIISNIILMNCILIYTKILFGLFSSYIVLIKLILNKKKKIF